MMMVVVIEATLALLVLAGSTMIVWGVRRFKLSSRAVALTFALTAASWVAFLITMIGATVRVFVLPNV